MTFSNLRLGLIALAVLPQLALAGTPTEEVVTCPIGGNQFTIIGTSSCSNSGERTMSFAPISSCDFITRLPQCPDNGLPLYKEFSEAELAQLPAILDGDGFGENTDKSRYFLAYLVETMLDDPDQTLGFAVLLQGLWYDHQTAFADPVYLQQFQIAAAAELKRMDPQDQPFLQALMAFVAARQGDAGAARALLAEVAKSPAAAFPLLASYSAAIEACIADDAADTCYPLRPIPLIE